MLPEAGRKRGKGRLSRDVRITDAERRRRAFPHRDDVDLCTSCAVGMRNRSVGKVGPSRSWGSLASFRLLGDDIRLCRHDKIVPMQSPNRMSPVPNRDFAPLGQDRRMMFLLFRDGRYGVRER